MLRIPSFFKSVMRLQTSRVLQTRGYKVCVLGASGALGQNLALLLKQSRLISELALYDLDTASTPIAGVAADLSHINTPAQVTAFAGFDSLEKCVRNAHLALITAGVARKPGMTRDDVFQTNATIVLNLMDACARHCPQAILAVITNPINSTLPIAYELYKTRGNLDPRRLLGVTTLDVMRANTMVAEAKGLDVTKVNCPVIGGRSSATIIPVFSQCTPAVTFPPHERAALTRKIQDAGDMVVAAKKGSGSASLCMSAACYRFARSVLEALDGRTGVVEFAYVRSENVETSFFAGPVLLGRNGVEKQLGPGSLNEFETELLARALPELKAQISRGEQFALEHLGELERRKLSSY